MLKISYYKKAFNEQAIQPLDRFQNNGFTLIEILVSVFLFFALIVMVLGFFGYALTGQRKALASQEISDQMSYVTEYISRSARMAKKDMGGTCLEPANAGKNYTNPIGDDSIRFLNYEGLCQEFYLEDGQLKRRKSTTGLSADFTVPVDLTSSKLKVNSAQFNIIGDSVGDTIQPRVTISFDVEKKDTDQRYNAQVKIQSTISQRNLDTN